MSAARLRFRDDPKLPVDAGRLTPAALAALPAPELERLPLRVGNRELPLAELAEVHAGESVELVIEAAFPGLARLGRGMAEGRLEIYGDVGPYLGQDMRGGRIELFGSAGDYAAAGMRGGIVHISATAGDCVGGALPGDRFGMVGGTVLIGGDAGDRLGDRMRRGLIAVTGAIGDFAAARMIGGTIVALGGCGAHAGYAMRRGTLLLAEASELLPTFADNGVHDLPWLRLLAHELTLHATSLALPDTRVRRWTGCASSGGKGEILVAA
jgi:formylmethanofuran dehydrogenase subunit C